MMSLVENTSDYLVERMAQDTLTWDPCYNEECSQTEPCWDCVIAYADAEQEARLEAWAEAEQDMWR